jgi:hypothetical protein
MKRKAAKRGIARKSRALTTAELKRLYAGLGAERARLAGAVGEGLLDKYGDAAAPYRRIVR